jgi:peptidoglycan L-alanyl-D-glutamate endopeptidase CwlK
MTMPEFSATSRQRLETCDRRLITLCREAILVVDFTVLYGHRSNEEQDELYAQGRTKPGNIVTNKKGGESIHNTFPSRAVDLAPWPIDWNDLTRFGELAGVMKAIAHDMMIPLQWGGDWPNFKDYVHFQISERP